MIGGLQILCYRTAFGRAFRATSDDPSVAQLMGLDNRHVFALAMALSLAVIAVAGVLLAIRANFDPAIGHARLIFGFEAVIIGGLGSMWGTLAGGIVLGVRRRSALTSTPAGRCMPDTSLFSSFWRCDAGRFPGAGLEHVPQKWEPVLRKGHAPPKGLDMSRAFHIEHGSRSSRIGTAALAIALLALIAAPAFAGRDDLRLMSEIFTYIALASLWNLLAGYAGLVSVGQQAYVGLAATSCSPRPFLPACIRLPQCHLRE